MVVEGDFLPIELILIVIIGISGLAHPEMEFILSEVEVYISYEMFFPNFPGK